MAMEEAASATVIGADTSAALNENALSWIPSTGPADIGGVAVIALGKQTSCSVAAAGDIGCAVRGVSGPVTKDGSPPVGNRVRFCVCSLRGCIVLMAVTGVERSMAVA